jgi:exopolysaccharide production protein ExoZ
MTTRVNSIDYLRGALALSVMFYHYASWGLGNQGAENLLSRLGIYAVASFYVVSGISLYLVYSTTTWNSISTAEFAKKRALRIYPLYILVTLITLSITSQQVDIVKLLGNLSIVFGFYSPNGHIPVGGWSVGNEIVFYVMFPLMMIMMRSMLTLAALAVGGLVLHAFFAFSVIDPEQSISSQSHHYMNPLNQVFFFIGGLFIGKFFSPGKGSRITIITFLLLGLAVFISWPASGDRVELISGWTRVAMTSACLFVCLAVFMSNWDAAGWLGKALKVIGDTSYSTYLLHGPIAIIFLSVVYPELKFIHSHHGKFFFLILVCAPLSILAGYISFHKFESPIMRLGKRRLVLRPE